MLNDEFLKVQETALRNHTNSMYLRILRVDFCAGAGDLREILTAKFAKENAKIAKHLHNRQAGSTFKTQHSI